MSEEQGNETMENDESQQTESTEATFTQAQLDEKIGSIRAADKASFRKSLEEKDAEIESLQAESQQKNAKDKTKSEHTSALENRVAELEARELESKRLMEEKDRNALVSSIESKDKDKLSELGFDSKYHKILLDEMYDSRKFEGNDHYYTKDKSAVDQSQILNDLVEKYPEFIGVNRPQGNKIPNASTASKSQESALSRVKNGESQTDVLNSIADAARKRAGATVNKSREANQIHLGNSVPKL